MAILYGSIAANITRIIFTENSDYYFGEDLEENERKIAIEIISSIAYLSVTYLIRFIV